MLEQGGKGSILQFNFTFDGTFNGQSSPIFKGRYNYCRVAFHILNRGLALLILWIVVVGTFYSGFGPGSCWYCSWGIVIVECFECGKPSCLRYHLVSGIFCVCNRREILLALVFGPIILSVEVYRTLSDFGLWAEVREQYKDSGL